MAGANYYSGGAISRLVCADCLRFIEISLNLYSNCLAFLMLNYIVFSIVRMFSQLLRRATDLGTNEFSFCVSGFG